MRERLQQVCVPPPLPVGRQVTVKAAVVHAIRNAFRARRQGPVALDIDLHPLFSVRGTLPIADADMQLQHQEERAKRKRREAVNDNEKLYKM